MTEQEIIELLLSIKHRRICMEMIRYCMQNEYPLVLMTDTQTEQEKEWDFEYEIN
jgi:hypothetical protein